MIRIICFAGVVALSWCVGIAIYAVSLYFLFDQKIKWGGDLQFTLAWSLVALLVAVPTIYLPCLMGLRSILGGLKPRFAFPLLAGLLGVFPTAFISLYWGGTFGFLWSSEAMLFYLLFAGVGITLGFGFIWCQCCERRMLGKGFDVAGTDPRL